MPQEGEWTKCMQAGLHSIRLRSDSSLSEIACATDPKPTEPKETLQRIVTGQGLGLDTESRWGGVERARAGFG